MTAVLDRGLRPPLPPAKTGRPALVVGKYGIDVDRIGTLTGTPLP